MAKILVITSLPDPHVDMVQNYLPEGIEFCFYDPSELSKSDGMTVYENGSINLLNKDSPLSVWYRKPKFLCEEDLISMNNIPEVYIQSISSMNVEGYSLVFGAYPNCLWVSNPYSIKKASNKLMQLSFARTFGFDVPKTIFSSRFEDINDFRLEVGDIVMKPLGFPYVKTNGKSHWLYATLITKSQKINYEGLSVTPMIFQQKINKIFDLRVTVIGNEVFGCRIYSEYLDSRKAAGRYFPVDLQDTFVKQCLNMVKSLGLNFGAFDFVQSTDGNLYFLEINPNGQWGFIEKKTNLPLSKAMANLLISSS